MNLKGPSAPEEGYFFWGKHVKQGDGGGKEIRKEIEWTWDFVSCPTVGILVLGWQKQENYKLKAGLNYLVRPSLRVNQENKWKANPPVSFAVTSSNNYKHGDCEWHTAIDRAMLIMHPWVSLLISPVFVHAQAEKLEAISLSWLGSVLYIFWLGGCLDQDSQTWCLYYPICH